MIDLNRELKMLPMYDDTNKSSIDLLTLKYEHELFELLGQMDDTIGQIAKPFMSYVGFDPDAKKFCFAKTKTNPYNEPIKTLTVSTLKLELNDIEIKTNRNKAILAFINQMPDEMRIALYWC